MTGERKRPMFDYLIIGAGFSGIFWRSVLRPK